MGEGGVHKKNNKPIYRGELPKKGGGLGQFADLRGGGGGLIPKCTLCGIPVFARKMFFMRVNKGAFRTQSNT